MGIFRLANDAEGWTGTRTKNDHDSLTQVVWMLRESWHEKGVTSVSRPLSFWCQQGESNFRLM